MSNLLPPPNPDKSSKAGPDEPGAPRRGPKNRKLPSTEEILKLVMHLNGLVATKFLSTSEATVIQRGLRMVLDVQTKPAQGGQGILPQEALAELCRADPHVLDLLEPFLTDEQAQWVMGSDTDDANE